MSADLHAAAPPGLTRPYSATLNLIAVQHCVKCNSEVPVGGRFCPSCATPVSTSQDSETVAISPGSTPAPRASTTSRPSASSSSGRLLQSQTTDEGRFLPGTLIAERYRVIGLLGRGGMGEVYRATDLTLSQPVALKFLPEAAGADQMALARFYNEVRIARQVSHPNVCRVYDVGQLDGQPYLSMEYIDGENLASLLRRIGRLPHDKAVEMGRRLCAGLAAAHARGVLHRDLKPANVMVDSQGQVLITDFGLAGIAGMLQGAEVRNGTPAYMAPEQLAGREVTVRSDIYSLGLVVYEMFTGRRAFEASTLAELIRVREESLPASPSTVAADLDPAVERVILRCLDPDPQSRPASALAVAAALPGGDPLAAALEAGETPSPELVAASGKTEGIAPRAALAWLGVILIGLIALPFIDSRAQLIPQLPLETPPDALAVQAREIIHKLGYTAKPMDKASGFQYNDDFMNWTERHGVARKWLPTPAGQALALTFWYRESPEYLIPWKTLSAGPLVKHSDPELDVPGMVGASLDAQGRLVSFYSVPQQVSAAPATPVHADWSALFAAAGLDSSQMKTVDPQWTPPYMSDERAAWSGAVAGHPDTTVRAEAAAWRGKPVWFMLIYPWSRPYGSPDDQTPAQKAVNILAICLFLAVIAGAALMARRNWRMGRVDRRGAIVLAGSLAVVNLAAGLLLGKNVPATDEFVEFLRSTSWCLYVGALVWMAYLALEPWVRRQWPHSIISWTRLLAGHVRDPRVGVDILAGICFGVVSKLVDEVINSFAVNAGGLPDQTSSLALVGGRFTIAPWGNALVGSIITTLGLFLLFFLCRLVARKFWLACAIFVLLFAAIAGLSSLHPAYDATDAFIVFALFTFVMLRYGLVTLASMFMVNAVLGSYALTWDFSAFYAGGSVLALVSIAVLAGLAFRYALGGRAILCDDL
jgi:serine/threonine-protein kinase